MYYWCCLTGEWPITRSTTRDTIYEWQIITRLMFADCFPFMMLTMTSYRCHCDMHITFYKYVILVHSLHIGWWDSKGRNASRYFTCYLPVQCWLSLLIYIYINCYCCHCVGCSTYIMRELVAEWIGDCQAATTVRYIQHCGV